ncbi:MAG TPA: VOC family protein [Candidatus Cybelea sp.]
MIQHCRYVIAVPDLRRSADYYRDVLGFEVIEVSAPGWRFLRRDDCVIMAGECRDALSPDALGDHAYIAYLEVDDVQKLHTSLLISGADVVKPLRAEPWGMCEFGVRTIDGHRIMFASPAT